MLAYEKQVLQKVVEKFCAMYIKPDGFWTSKD
jgi:hypothetical protein